MLKLWALLYRHAKVHEIAVNAIMAYGYKWPTYNICVSSMKLTYSSKDSLFHNESIHIDFKFQANHAYSPGTVGLSRGLA